MPLLWLYKSDAAQLSFGVVHHIWQALVFGAQKAEMMIKAQFPSARVLRMDMDTTSKTDGHEQIS